MESFFIHKQDILKNHKTITLKIGLLPPKRGGMSREIQEEVYG